MAASSARTIGSIHTSRLTWTLAAAVCILTAAFFGLVQAGSDRTIAFTEQFAIPPAFAASSDYLLELDGIEGESTDESRPGAITVDSFSWGVSQMGTRGGGGGGGAGKVNFQDFSIMTTLSKASPMLFLASATGQHIKEAKLTARRSSGQQDYLVITLSDVMVSSYQSAGGGGGIPSDSFSLNFAKIEFSYTPTNPDGSAAAPIVATYDLKANKK